MPTPWSFEAAQVLADAEEIASEARKPFDSSHVLLAIFATSNRAHSALKERGVDEDQVIAWLGALPRETPEAVPAIRERACALAESHGWPDVDCLHLLIAIARTRESRANALLERCGVDLVQLRTQLVSYFTSGNIPRRLGGSRGAVPPAERTPPRPTVRPASANAVATPQPEVRPSAPSLQPSVQAASSPRPQASSIPTASTLSTPQRAFAQAPRAGVVVTVAPPREEPRCPVALDQLEFPWLTSLGRNLSQLAWEQQLDPLIGRDQELESVLDILHKRRANNPCLVGEPGVGKTALVEGLAMRLLEEDAAHGTLGAHVLIELNMGTLVAGTHLRGSFSERLNGVQNDVKRAAGRVVVFIDEIHNLVGAGATGESAQDAANELKAALARGEFPCIGATTIEEYRKHIEKDSALARRFQVVELKEPTADEAIAILRGVVPSYELHHGVTFDRDAIEAAVRLSSRYIVDRRLPDKALAVLDHAGARTRREGRTRVGWDDVARAVAAGARLPTEKIVRDEDRIRTLEAALARQVVGQDHVLSAVADTLRRNLAGFHGGRPIASLLFIGQSGVGKSHLAAVLAECLFETRDALARFDMGEFAEALSVSRMVGAAPGYVGHDRGGELTEAMRRRPHQVVLFDDIDRAHPDVTALLLQILDEARLCDTRGRIADFRNAVVVLTVTRDAADDGRRSGAIGFGKSAARGSADADVLEDVSRALPAALWSRVDARLVFQPLGRADLAELVRREAARSSERLDAERGIRFVLADGAIDLLLKSCSADAGQGARTVRSAFQRLVESEIANRIVAGTIGHGQIVIVRPRGSFLDFSVAE